MCVVVFCFKAEAEDKWFVSCDTDIFVNEVRHRMQMTCRIVVASWQNKSTK